MGKRKTRNKNKTKINLLEKNANKNCTTIYDTFYGSVLFFSYFPIRSDNALKSMKNLISYSNFINSKQSKYIILKSLKFLQHNINPI